MAIPIERIHELGAKRHNGRWILANQRAVEELWGSRLKVDAPEVRDTIPRIVLRILDWDMLDRGYRWNNDLGQWEPKSPVQNALATAEGKATT